MSASFARALSFLRLLRGGLGKEVVRTSLSLSPSLSRCETPTLWLARTPVTLITRLFVFEIDTGYENVRSPRFFPALWNFRLVRGSRTWGWCELLLLVRSLRRRWIRETRSSFVDFRYFCGEHRIQRVSFGKCFKFGYSHSFSVFPEILGVV